MLRSFAEKFAVAASGIDKQTDGDWRRTPSPYDPASHTYHHPRGRHCRGDNGPGNGESALTEHTVEPLGSTISFVQTLTRDTPMLAHEGEVWSIFVSSFVGSIFCTYQWHVLKPLSAEFFSRTINMYLQFPSFLYTDMTQAVESFLIEDKYLPILHSQYHGCWCPGDTRSQDISTLILTLVKPGYLSPHMSRVNKSYKEVPL